MRERSTASWVWRSLAGHLWFGFWFWLAIPAALLWGSGRPLAPAPGIARTLGLLGFVACQLAMACQIALFIRRGRGSQLPFDPPAALVVQGSYRRVRNPMYVSYGMAIACEALAYREWVLVAYTLGFAALAHAYVVGVEESSLRKRFGDAYDDYCARTGRWWPR